jgi:hypothetical protein
MTIEKINTAFNEALEEISSEDNETYSMDFVQHHEATLEKKLQKLQRANQLQFIIFIIIFLFIIFNQGDRFVKIPYDVNRFMFLGLWGIILINNFFSTKRSKKITQLEQQLLLIGVYKKVME